ncbi:class I SAM-dependent methyltransferase [Tundrisphaera sp. TA3]|uniref:class I SAM-dependent methyltransferase n=1 Tax=Tundrisphaera sp. TA3 TaxID=3435775 RepID=UPI003EB83A42
MPRPPLWLKRLLLPAWNGGHHLAWKVGEVAGSIGQRRWGRCEVCGTLALYLHRPRAIPAELRRRWGLTTRVATAVVHKETDDCSHCGAKLRARRLARVLLDLYPTDVRPARSMADWVETAAARSLRVAEFNRVEGLHEILARLPRFEASDYRDGAEPGSVIDGVRSEDLTRLTYPDGAFDLVLTSETLEHVPDLEAALREIRRVLAPGGRHVFTVPLLPGVPLTFARARLEPDGTKVDLAPPICHPGGDVGYPVFTEFGADFPDLVRRAGFEVEVRFGPTTEDDVAQVYVARRVG